MSENNNDLFGGNGIDLGSDIGASFDDFPSFDDPGMNMAFGEDINVSTLSTDTQKDEEVPDADTEISSDKADEITVGGTDTEVKTDEKVTPKTPESSIPDGKNEPAKKEETADFFSQAIAAAETKQAEDAKSSLIDKPPIFVYGGAKEEIVDITKTFDALRIEKAEDFPELDDGTSVSWKMTYGTISKAVSTPKKTTIMSLKKDIEKSKEFVDMLKKAKDDVKCKLIPSVTAKKKGTAPYKGAFLTIADAAKSDKVIAFVPSDDGRVYEVRRNPIGTFITAAEKVTILDKVRAGFIPALPKIPHSILMQIVSLFKAYAVYHSELEALAYIYWSVEDEHYYIYIPKQQVSRISVKSTIPELDENKFILAMEIHSHNTMSAEFSHIDDHDEKATRLYAVVGNLDKFFPDIKVRFCVGGNFVEIDPDIVFEGIERDFPNTWINAIEKRDRI